MSLIGKINNIITSLTNEEISQYLNYNEISNLEDLDNDTYNMRNMSSSSNFKDDLNLNQSSTNNIQNILNTNIPKPTLMDDAIVQATANNKILRYFNRMLMGYEVDGLRQYSPDINGFVFIFMLPPHLSGYKLTTDKDGDLGKIAKTFAFLGMDFTPPPTTVVTSSIPSRSGAITYGSEVESSGQLQITFLDNDVLNVFGYHKTWVSYIEDISRGVISPDDEYMSPNGSKFGEIDYATSAYVARFRPTSSTYWGDLVYVGKAIGIFPITLPDKEVIGRRDSNEITMLPITYACTFYRQCVFGSPVETNQWIYEELKSQILDAY